MNIFLKELSENFSDNSLVPVCDGAAWHKSNMLEIPKNIEIIFIPPYTPEMNPIEQIWKEIRKIGFKNEVFQTLNKLDTIVGSNGLSQTRFAWASHRKNATAYSR